MNDSYLLDGTLSVWFPKVVLDSVLPIFCQIYYIPKYLYFFEIPTNYCC